MTEPRILGDNEVAVPIALVKNVACMLRSRYSPLLAERLEACLPPKPSAHDEAVRVVSEELGRCFRDDAPAWVNEVGAGIILDALTPDLLRALADEQEHTNG